MISMAMVRQSTLSGTFRSRKPQTCPNPKIKTNANLNPNPNPNANPEGENSESSKRCPSWCVYLIASTNPPLKTYVGVTTNFSRRLQQHNGELKGGAKASRSGRPWVCACIVQGFANQSQACEFEAKWKVLSRKLPRKQKIEEDKEKGLLLLLQHRYAAMGKLNCSFDSGHLQVDWRISPP